MSEAVKNQSKICLACKRPFSNRKKWQSRGGWDKVLYCSKKCRSSASKKTVTKQ